MEISYDESSDVLYVRIAEAEETETVHTEEDVLIRKNSETGEIVGYTVIGFREREKVTLPEKAEMPA